MNNQTEEEFWEEFRQLEEITKGCEYKPKTDKWKVLKPNYCYYGIIKKCPICNTIKITYPKAKYCSAKCRANDPKYKKKISKQMSVVAKERWKDPEFRKKHYIDSKERWKDPEYRRKHSERWKDPEFRKKHSIDSKERWKDPEYRKKMSISIKRSNKQKPIKTNKIFHKIIKNKYPILYKEHFNLQIKKNKTKNEIKLMNEMWDRLYRKNPETQLQIAMEVDYQKELEQIPLTQCNLNNLKGERK